MGRRNNQNLCRVIERVSPLRLYARAQEMKLYLDKIPYMNVYSGHIIYWDTWKCITAPCEFLPRKVSVGVNNSDIKHFNYDMPKHEFLNEIKKHLKSYFTDVSAAN